MRPIGKRQTELPSASGAERLGDAQKWKRPFCGRVFFSSSEFPVFGRQF